MVINQINGQPYETLPDEQFSTFIWYFDVLSSILCKNVKQTGSNSALYFGLVLLYLTKII